MSTKNQIKRLKDFFTPAIPTICIVFGTLLIASSIIKINIIILIAGIVLIAIGVNEIKK